jgi:hypothetical protein
MSSCVLRTIPSPPHSFPLADQLVLQRSEFALLISGDSAQDILTRCHHHNEKIPWDSLATLDVQTPQHFQNVPSDPVEQFLNLEELQMTEGAIYESMAQPDDIVSEYDGPVCGLCRFRVET